MESGQMVKCLDLPVIKNFPGLIVLQHKRNDNDDEQGIISWNRCMAYCCLNSAPTNVYSFYRHLPTFLFTTKTESQRRSKYRHHIDTIRRVFAIEKGDDIVKYTVGQYSMQTRIDEKQCYLITKHRRDDIYHPIAILQDNKLIGGLQMNLRLYEHMPKNANANIISIHSQPIRSIYTGMCMHGTNVKLVDNSGYEHLMYVTPDELAKDQIIVEAIEKFQSLHPYEKLAYKTFENLIPLFYIFGNGIMPTIYFYLPTAEYIIHALDLFLSGHMTTAAFHQNVHYIIKCTAIHYQWLTNLCSQNNIQLITETPLEKLVLEVDGNFCLQSFLNRIQVPIDLLDNNQANQNLSTYVAERCWIWLCQSQKESHGSIWKFIKDKGANVITGNLLEMNSLQSLKYLSYTVQITSIMMRPDSKQILVALPFCEKQVCLSYKNLLADKYGSILGLHWMMPILSNVSYNNDLYYLEDYLDPLDRLIEDNIVSHSFLETGAAAINIDAEHVYPYSRVKAQLLLEHGKVVEQQLQSLST